MQKFKKSYIDEKYGPEEAAAEDGLKLKFA